MNPAFCISQESTKNFRNPTHPSDIITPLSPLSVTTPAVDTDVDADEGGSSHSTMWSYTNSGVIIRSRSRSCGEIGSSGRRRVVCGNGIRVVSIWCLYGVPKRSIRVRALEFSQSVRAIILACSQSQTTESIEK